MTKVVVINPNTSRDMSADIRQTAERVFQSPWTVEVVNAPAGPESLESWRDYHLASVTSIPLLEQHSAADGFVLACFGDPGLYLLKEVTVAPVIGIAEAAMSLALLLGGRFGILAGMGRAVQLMDSMVRTYGLESRYAGTVSLDLHILDFKHERTSTMNALENKAGELIQHGADVLLLGCAGLTGFVSELQQRLSVTVIDPVEAGCRMLQTVVDANLRISHVGIYAQPTPQRMNDLQQVFSPSMTATLRNWEHGQL